jgi:hypothetical protein
MTDRLRGVLMNDSNYCIILNGAEIIDTFDF